jgi:cold shock CspA family protein
MSLTPVRGMSDPLAQVSLALQAELNRRARRKLEALLRGGDRNALVGLCRQLVECPWPDFPEPEDLDEVHPEQQLEELVTVARRLAQRGADEAAGIVRRPRSTTRVRSANQVVVPKPKLDPAAPKVVSRRAREPLSSGAPPEDGMTHRGVVLRFDQRAMSGTILDVGSGKEIAIAEGAVQRAGLTNLFPRQHVQFRVEADHNGPKAETIRLV